MSYRADQRLKLSPDQDAIPMDFIKAYFESLVEAAIEFGDSNVAMRDAALSRADHITDLVQAWKERNK